MIRNRNSCRIPLNIVTISLLLIEILHKGTCSVIKKQDSIILDNLNSNQNPNQNSDQHLYRSNSNHTNIETTEADDPNYPYEQILQLVKDTKRIIMSSNETEKKQLNFEPYVYTRYLQGDLSDYFQYAGVPYPSSVDVCPYTIQTRRPKRLIGEDNKEYYIINVGKELKQEYRGVVCRDLRSRCSYSGLSEGYSFFCKTNFDRKMELLSIPVDNEISLSQQRLRSLLVEGSCTCAWNKN